MICLILDVLVAPLADVLEVGPVGKITQNEKVQSLGLWAILIFWLVGEKHAQIRFGQGPFDAVTHRNRIASFSGVERVGLRFQHSLGDGQGDNGADVAGIDAHGGQSLSLRNQPVLVLLQKVNRDLVDLQCFLEPLQRMHRILVGAGGGDALFGFEQFDVLCKQLVGIGRNRCLVEPELFKVRVAELFQAVQDGLCLVPEGFDLLAQGFNLFLSPGEFSFGPWLLEQFPLAFGQVDANAVTLVGAVKGDAKL